MDVLNYVQTNTAILNVLWSLTCGRKMHAQQQEFQVGFFLLKKTLVLPVQTVQAAAEIRQYQPLNSHLS
jgi:hypothetical protein